MTIPTKEQALAAYIRQIDGNHNMGASVLAEKIIAYIEGEKDSLGADEARKEALENMPEGRNCGDLIRWIDKHEKTIRAALSAPASAHVPGFEKVRQFIESFRIGVDQNAYYKDTSISLIQPHAYFCRVSNNSDKSWLFADLEKRRVEALAILDQQGAPSESQRVTDLLEANNRYLQRARDAEQKLANVRSKIEGVRKVTAFKRLSGEEVQYNAALDAVIAMIDGGK